MSSDTTKWPQWLKDAITTNADVEINEYGQVVWHGGVWRGGVWRGGEWRGGEWLGGEWRGGVWRGGVWHGGVWHGGVWRGGEWLGGEWHGGEWLGGEWRGGVWRGGVWHGGVWHGGVWRGGVWRGGEWHGVKGDFFDVLLRVPHEVDGLIAALKAGKIDGSVYQGDCACLCGTIANLQHCEYTEIPGLSPDSSRPIERFFLAIRPGHTPENNPWCKQAVAWAEEFQGLIANLRKP